MTKTKGKFSLSLAAIAPPVVRSCRRIPYSAPNAALKMYNSLYYILQKRRKLYVL